MRVISICYIAIHTLQYTQTGPEQSKTILHICSIERPIGFLLQLHFNPESTAGGVTE